MRFPLTGPVRYSMTGRDAAEVCRLLDPRVVVPVHYEGWSHFSQDRGGVELQLNRNATEVIRRRFRWLTLGSATAVQAFTD